MFGLPEMPDPKATRPAFAGEGCLALYTARCAIRVLIEALAPRRVWMPSYLCPDMLQALAGTLASADFYEVDAALRMADGNWCARVEPNDLVLYIDYFGFPFDDRNGALDECRRRGAILVRDAAQALLSEPAFAADFSLYSPRKFLGVPDGGVLAPGRKAVPVVPTKPPPPEWVLKTTEATVLRREFDRHGGSRRWFDLFREHEPAYPVGAFAMSDLAQSLLAVGFDYAAIARRRRENYSLLAARLGRWAIFPSLPPGVVPLGFPVRLADRDRLRRALFDHEIYPPVHWALGESVPRRFEQSHCLSQELMTLPCDQRYGVAEMERLAACFLSAAG